MSGALGADNYNRASLAPVVEDLSAFIIAGAVGSDPSKFESETEGRTPAQGIEDGIEAERLGYRRVWLSERIDIKWSDVILSGVAARTSRLELATGVVDPPTRHPWTMAALGATMQACYGERFVLGLGRGNNGYFKGSGIEMPSFEYMSDYVDILRRLWNGEEVTYEGPVGRFEGLSFAEAYHGTDPPIWFGGFAHKRGARFLAERCDGAVLIPMFTPAAVHDAKQRIVEACDRADRDPDELRIVALVVTAPDLDDTETRAITAGRMVTYMTYPGYGEALVEANGWDRKVLDAVRSHPLFSDIAGVPDRVFGRQEMLEVADRIPWEYLEECSAIGTPTECASSLQRFIDAGADEIATYGSTPAQNAALISAWRDRGAAT